MHELGHNDILQECTCTSWNIFPDCTSRCELHDGHQGWGRKGCKQQHVCERRVSWGNSFRTLGKWVAGSKLHKISTRESVQYQDVYIRNEAKAHLHLHFIISSVYTQCKLCNCTDLQETLICNICKQRKFYNCTDLQESFKCNICKQRKLYNGGDL